MRDLTPLPSDTLPKRPGVGYKPDHFTDLMNDPGAVGWLEIHAENYMGDGGRPIAQLQKLAERFAISVHGVGLSIGGEAPLDVAHLARLRHLVDWLDPASFSEHLAWSSHGNQFLNDLLPLPYTAQTLARVADHINQVQDHLGRRMLLENPSSYLTFTESEMTETAFLAAICDRTGCGLLLDVNNVFVSATNLKTDPHAYLNAFALTEVCEIHLGGHDPQEDEHGDTLLIDSHSAPVTDPVWALYDAVLAQTGPLPSLIEWDNDVPDWPVLAAEADRAATALNRVGA